MRIVPLVYVRREWLRREFEPSASLVLSESGLPVAYRASVSSGGWNRTSGLHVQSVVLLPAATTPESSRTLSSGRRIRTSTT